ncbi:MAG TPA: hypothetical protein DEB73_00320 [Candidatus Magasanikbacteria bacterium]|uniref:Uncharacterized protein n=2 Tax=Candidatus Magasanikiibacteriota TaxID=1752731 RepID=A0A0G0YV71_9BACT|nr:MAG: hypothetical protein UU49_C0005G0045 [Candidatus Magasanikbacteria bacterium GW2011_GWC2_41_17]KKS13571.1 MAG: hypothetical protein UU69_C0002G0006 [Candidatus Magasanikbacteria bacterium GW2011_GWA2_41_55]HBV57713.1 hypothetical protein [Candidatus Magasanikbacteria bacterium]HBX16215.1 hypothetical protein [Candidatus Magasanikbacteria bacterium]
MQIIIEAEKDELNEEEQKCELKLTNDDCSNNPNFVDMILDDKEYTISVEDLFRAVEVFEKIRRDGCGDMLESEES